MYRVPLFAFIIFNDFVFTQIYYENTKMAKMNCCCSAFAKFAFKRIFNYDGKFLPVWLMYFCVLGTVR